ncbi:MAG TPA: hypothetical protein DEG96_05420 [Candidatus Atribacteria bacterium]|nr:hypothetical protein [Candidatus Atribacteria bacterium]
MKTEDKIKRIIEYFFKQKGYSLHSIFLFGSRVRQNYEEESDYDLFIILNDKILQKEKKQLTMQVLRALHKEMKFTPFDVIIKSRKDFEEEKDIVNTISNEVSIEGIKL